MKLSIALLALTLLANSAFAATAVWTGRQVQVQTVTYQWAWSCEYMYAGQKFWQVYQGSCPNSINIQ